jgi:hypothetical protein
MQLRHAKSSTVARPVAPKSTRTDQRPHEKPVELILNQPVAQSVAVAGSFNDWDLSRTPMSPGPGGTNIDLLWMASG